MRLCISTKFGGLLDSDKMAKAKILVVEDEAITAKDLQDELRGLGYDAPAIASSGEGAIKKAEEIKPDLVLMDIVLKGDMDGIEAAERIRDLFDIPVVYVTAYLDEERLEKTKVTEPYGYIIKPFGDKDLRPVIEMALQRHKLEKALRESEIRFRELFDNISSGVAVYEAKEGGKDFVFKDFNKVSEKMEGIKKEDLLGKSVLEVFPGVIDFGLFEVFQRVWNTGKPEHFPISFYKDDRIAGWRENYVYKLPSGEIVAVYVDITERKQAEEALLQSEIKYRTLVEHLPAITYIAALDESSTTRYASPQIETILGISAADYKADPDFWVKHLHPDDRERVMDEIRRCHESDQPFISEYRMVSKDGRLVWLSDDAVIVKDDKGKPLHLQGVMYDITERKQMEEKQSLFSHALDSSIDGLAMGDLEGRITYVNDAFVRMFGYSREELIGNEIAFIYPENQLPKLEEALKATMDGGWIGELVGRRKNGELFPIAISSSLIKDAEGNVIAHMASHQDISERKRAENELKKKNKELELFNRLAVGRELKMIELKKEINALLEDLGKEPRYEIAGEEDKKNYEL